MAIDDDWLNQDAQYNATLAALQRRLASSDALFAQRTSAYDQNYQDTLRLLGYTQGVGWDRRDPLTLSGSTLRGLENSYAGRGMLQSSGYATAQDTAQRDLNQQLSRASTARQQYMDSQGAEQLAARDENLVQQQQARANALARRAGTYQIGG